MAGDFGMLQSSQRDLSASLEAERRQRALSDAIIERRLELASIPHLSDADMAEVQREIMRRFPLESPEPVGGGPEPKQIPARRRQQKGRL